MAKRDTVEKASSNGRLVDSMTSSRLADSWEATAGQQLLVLIQEWNQVSTNITRLREQANLRRLFTKGARRPVRREAQKEAAELEEKAAPLLDNLEVITWRIVDVLTESPGARNSTNNWRLMVRPLRAMVATGLKSRGIDLAEMIQDIDRQELASEAEEAPED